MLPWEGSLDPVSEVLEILLWWDKQNHTSIIAILPMPRLLQLLQILLQEYLTSGVGIPFPSPMLYKLIRTIIHETWSPKSSKRSQWKTFQLKIQLMRKCQCHSIKSRVTFSSCSNLNSDPCVGTVSPDQSTKSEKQK